MKRKVKIKLSFAPEVSIASRRAELFKWAKGVYRITNIVVLEEQHLERMSYIVIQQP
jgi:hypothetical protein